MALIACCHTVFNQQLTAHLSQLIGADPLKRISVSANSIQSSYLFTNFYTKTDDKRSVKLQLNGLFLGSNYSVPDLQMHFKYFRPDFQMSFDDQIDSYQIKRHFKTDFYSIESTYGLFQSTKLTANFKQLNNSEYGIGIKQHIDRYRFGLFYHHSNQLIELFAKSDDFRNNLILPMGFSAITATVETDLTTFSYENRAFDQTLNQGIRTYSNSGRQINLSVNSNRFHLTVDYSLTDFSLSAKQSTQLFLLLSQLNMEQLTISKRFQFRRWKLRLFYQRLELDLKKDDSFLDAWPFNVFDFLNSDRFRLIKFKSKIQNLGFETKREFQYKRVHFSGLFNYEHYFMDGELQSGRRYFIIFPVLTDYSYFSDQIDSSIDAIIRVKFKSSYRLSKFEFNIAASQLIPIDYSRINKKGSSGTSKSEQSGGFQFQLGLKYYFK